MSLDDLKQLAAYAADRSDDATCIIILAHVGGLTMVVSGGTQANVTYDRLAADPRAGRKAVDEVRRLAKIAATVPAPPK